MGFLELWKPVVFVEHEVGIKRLSTNSEHRVGEEYTEVVKMDVHCYGGQGSTMSLPFCTSPSSLP